MTETKFEEIFPGELRPAIGKEVQAYQPRGRPKTKPAPVPEGYEYRPGGRLPKNKRRFSKRLVVFLVTFATAIIVTTIIFNWTGRLIQDSIIYVGLAAILGELTLVHSLTRQERKLEMEYELAIAGLSNGTGNRPEPGPENQPEVL